MALKHPVQIEDVTYPEAYSRILFVRLMKEAGFIFVNTYADEAARQREDMPIRQHEAMVVASGLIGDVYKLAYDHLKTLPEYAEASTYPDGDDVKPPPAADPEPVQPEAQA